MRSAMSTRGDAVPRTVGRVSRKARSALGLGANRARKASSTSAVSVLFSRAAVSLARCTSRPSRFSVTFIWLDRPMRPYVRQANPAGPLWRASRVRSRTEVRVDNVHTVAKLSIMAVSNSTVINLRTPKALRALIDRAAELQGKSRTEFMLEASREKAQQVLLDQALFTVSPAQYVKFQALMNAPLSKNAALKRLLSRKAPWEK